MSGASSPPSRLRQSLAAEAAAVVSSEHRFGSAQRELHMTATIDAAHTLMLAETSLLPAEAATALARVQWALLTDAAGLATLAETSEPRGTYVAYENHLIAKVGIEIGGLVHMGRSRNDINATLFAMHMRMLYGEVAGATLQLRDALIRRAQHHATTPFVVYSQFQPALPGTFGFWLAGIEEAVARLQRHLEAVATDLEACPMGGGGGAGTELPIDPRRTARYLGFERPAAHALDAIASRDAAISFTAAAANLGVLLTRVAQDLQLWTTRENPLVRLPDSLVGTSSMMPQKRNPYLLEKIKGKAARLVAGWTSAVAPSLKVPFSNALEVGTESILDVARSARLAVEALTLTRMLVEAADVDAKAVARARNGGVVDATSICNAMVVRGECSFRQAHDRVGGTIRDALERGDDAAAAVATLAPELAADGDVALALRHGGGPGAFASPEALNPAIRRHEDARRRLDDRIRHWHGAYEGLLGSLEAAATRTL